MSIAGLTMLLGGTCLAVGGAVQLGAALTPLTYPATKAVLHETCVYRVVRHPIYCGVIVAAFGWALVNHGWLTIVYVVAGFVFLDVKVRQEEKWLIERFSAYTAYQRRVRKLIPFVY